MQNPRSNLQLNFQDGLRGGGIAIEPANRNDSFHSVVTDLADVIEHVKASLRSIEREIARETISGGQETSSNVIELDDVTPPYVRVSAALKACDAHLAIAFRSLLDSKMPESGASDHVGRPPARATGNA